MAYVSIDGVQYEKELIDLAVKHTTGRGEGQIARDEAEDLINSALDGPGVTETEMRTLQYIRASYPFTDAAARYYDEAISKL